MTRAEIMEYCPEGFEDQLKDIVDHFEREFNSIRDKLDIKTIDQLTQIEEAHDIASCISSDLY